MKNFIKMLLVAFIVSISSINFASADEINPKLIGKYEFYREQTYGDEMFPLIPIPTFSKDGNTYYLPVKKNGKPYIISNGKDIKAKSLFKIDILNAYEKCDFGSDNEYKKYCSFSINLTLEGSNKSMKTPIVNFLSDYSRADDNLYSEHIYSDETGNILKTKVKYNGKEITLDGKYDLFFSPNRKFAVGFGPNESFYELWFDTSVISKEEPKKEAKEEPTLSTSMKNNIDNILDTKIFAKFSKKSLDAVASQLDNLDMSKYEDNHIKLAMVKYLVESFEKKYKEKFGK